MPKHTVAKKHLTASWVHTCLHICMCARTHVSQGKLPAITTIPFQQFLAMDRSSNSQGQRSAIFCSCLEEQGVKSYGAFFLAVHWIPAHKIYSHRHGYMGCMTWQARGMH